MTSPVLPAGPVGLSCGACGSPAVCQWKRRPTTAELAAIVAANTFSTAPTAANTTILVMACATHAITADLASRIHQNTCVAPPTCGCTPEPSTANSSPNPGVAVALPTGW